MLLGLLVMGVMIAVLSCPLAARSATRRLRSGRRRPRAISESHGAAGLDPGRERRAERRARELLKSCVNDEEWRMYRDLGFIRIHGRPRREAGVDAAGPAPYAYLVYPHRPIVAYEPQDGRLLGEYCVDFPDVGSDGPARLPASDDVLAKWMALTSDEARVIARANMHLVGRQHDPRGVRRDLWRLSEWERRESSAPAEAGAA